MNEPQTIDDLVRRAVGARGEAPALADAPNRGDLLGGEPRRLTWTELDAEIDAMVAALAARGIRMGDPVAVQLPNVVELPVLLLACFRLGAVAVPFPIQHRSHELLHGVETAGFALMVTADRPDRPGHLDACRDLFADRGTAGTAATAVVDMTDLTGLADVAANPAGPTHPLPAGGPTRDSRATICWTSGTTGTPKGVPRTHAQWMASSSYQVAQLGIGADDRILCPFPVVNMAGIGGMLVPWVESGAFLALHHPLDLQVFLAQLQGEAITYTVVPPAALNMLLGNEALLESLDLSNIRAISSGSAPLDPWMVQGWQERGIEIVNVFGSNEGAALLSTMAAVPDPVERARFFPVPDRPGVEVRLVDLDTGDEITEAGRAGELRFRGSTVFDGYIGSTGEEFDDQGYYRTGDLFRLAGNDDPPRLLQFVDRAKDIIIRRGMNISAAEVEAIVSGHPAIVECAAIGYPDRDLGEKLGVFAVAAPDADPTLADIIALMRDHDVASYKLPERLELIDALPRNPVGKITKPELRQRWRTT